MEAHFWLDWIRSIFGFFDSVIYGLVNSIYVTFTNMASYSIISQDMIQKFATRIYALVGIFMLFKVSVSLINYFVDPDSFYDSSKGFGNIVKRIIVALIMLVSVSLVFEVAFKVQTVVLQENIIGNLILGGTLDSKDIKASDVYATAGTRMGFVTLQAFLHPEDEDFINNNNLNDKQKEVYEEWVTVVKDSDIDGLIDLKNREDGDDHYIFRYSFGISTLAGFVVGFLLLRFCFDVAIRSVKLAFLQLIAPIPIISYVDPKSDMFNKWLKQCTSTYISLFIRLVAIFFVIFVISVMTSGSGGVLTIYEYTLDGSGNLSQKVANNMAHPFLDTALIIIGLLMFASEIPKLLEELFGLSIGGFSLNPFKNRSVASAAIGGLGGMALGGIINRMSSRKKRAELRNSEEYKKIDQSDDSFFDKVWNKHELYSKNGLTASTLKGMVGGAFRSGKASANGNIGAGITGGVTATSANRNLRAQGYGNKDKIADWWTDVSQLPKSTGTTSELANRVKQAQQRVNDLKQQEGNVDRARQSFVQALLNKTNVSASELNRVASYEFNPETKERTYSGYTGAQLDEILGDSKKLDKAYDQYSEDAKKRGLADDVMLTKDMYREQMSLNRDELRVDTLTKSAEKDLKKVQESMNNIKDARKKQ